MPDLPDDSIFISYSRRDGEVMNKIVLFLRDQGFKVWVDNERLIPGTPIWEEEIEKAIKACGTVLIIMSPDSKSSECVRREISLADQYRKHIMPVLVRGDEDSSITLRLVTRQFVDLRKDETRRLTSLHNALVNHMGKMHERFEERSNASKDATTTNLTNDISVSEVAKPSYSPTMNQSLPWFAIGWTISRTFLIDTLDADKATSWAIGTAIAWAIGGFVTSRQVFHTQK